MAEISISLAYLFEQAFGYKTKAFHPDFETVQGDKQLSRIEQGAQGSPYYAIDSLGVEYFMPVTLTCPEGLSGDQSMNQASNKYNLPFPVISIASRKTIIETPLTERRGTVKELVNIMDYDIVIRGFIIGAGNVFPEKEVTALRDIYEKNVALSIQCPLTDVFLLRPDRKGSDKVVITELVFPQVTGIKNVRPYQLRLVSDEEFNLVSIN